MNINLELLQKVINEVEELSILENKPLEGRIIKFNEEYGEFSAEIIKLLGYTYKTFDRQHLIEEGTDAGIVFLSIILKLCKLLDIEFNEFLEIAVVKNQKWRDKMPHYTNDTRLLERDIPINRIHPDGKQKKNRMGIFFTREYWIHLYSKKFRV